MSKLPFFPLYVNDFISDTQDLTDEEIGCYIRLLMYQWKQAKLPAELKRCLLFANSLERSWPAIEKHFYKKNGCYYNKRIEEEREKAIEIHRVRAEAGKKGGSKKKAKGEANDKQSLSKSEAFHSSHSTVHSLHSTDQNPQSKTTEEPPISPQGESGEKIPYSEIIADLNEKSGRKYRPCQSTNRLIKARWEEGFRLEDFQTVHNNQCVKWLNDPEMSEYIRPETLYRASKFQGYLNAPPNLYQTGQLSKSGARAASNIQAAFDEIENEL